MLACRQHVNGTNYYFCQSTKVDSETFVGLQAITLLKYSTSVITSSSYCFFKGTFLGIYSLTLVWPINGSQSGTIFSVPPPQKKTVICTHSTIAPRAQVQYKSEFITPYED